MNFGKLAAQPARAKTTGKAFRIAVLGDFSGRANAGKIETGAALASRKPSRIDIDNFESVLARTAPRLRLAIGSDGGSIEVAIGSMDDFHPDQLYKNVEVFTKLSGLRKLLKNSSTFAEAAKTVQSWSNISAASGTLQVPVKSGGAMIPRGKLDDFARLIGRNSTAAQTTSIRELVKQIVAPHVVPAPHPDQQALIAAVDEALTASMLRVLHNSDFQSLESLWRSVELLTRSLETDAKLQILLYDITAEELAADLSSGEALEDTGFYRLLVERPIAEGQDPLSVFLGNYLFDRIPPHAELLGRIGKIAAAAQAPFIAGISADSLRRPKQEEVHPLVEESWDTLRAMPHAQYLGLTVPRFMLRYPYGAKSVPIDSFAFEEFSSQVGLKGLLWANGSILAGLLLGQTYSEQGLPGMELGSKMVLGDVPFYYYTDENNDQIALPCTERWVSEPVAMYATSQHLMPVLSIRGRPEIGLGSFGSLHGPELAGPWAPVVIEPDEKPPVTEDGNAEAEAPTCEADEIESSAAAPDDSDDLTHSGAEATFQPDAEANVETGDDADANESTPTATDELDALLAELESENVPEKTDDTQMDPELAELLASL
jgi:type VI secretion system protein ImpC